MAKLDFAQLEQLREIGAYLHQTRKTMSKPIEDVAAEIFIRASLIRAIEEGDADALPEPIFIQGFIRRYGEALGLDGIALSKEFVVQPVGVTFAVNQGNQGNHNQVETPVAAEPEPPNPAPIPVVESVQPVRPSVKLPLIPIAIAGAAIVVVGGAIAVIQNLGSQPSNPTEANNTPGTNEASGDSQLSATEDTTDGTIEDESTTTPEAPPEAPVVVSVDLNGDAWMRVIADGNSVYEGTLSQGTTETWTAEREIRITTGNAGAVSLSHNGGEANPAGAPGSVETLTFTASN
ncbi:MAG: RodZ domain-containing protein [Cyanobacteria bacterium J06639_16]